MFHYLTKRPLLWLLAGILSACGPGDTYQQISHRQWLEKAPHSIGQSHLSLTDAGRNNRLLKVELWYPTADTTLANPSAESPFQLPPTVQDARAVTGTLPLVLLSHGTGGNRISLMWLACELAGQGYIVAAVDHFGNTHDNKIPEQFVRIWERPKDISFVLDHLLNDGYWRSKIDTAQIGMVGFSLGGYTAIALAGGEISYEALQKFAQTAEGKTEFTLPELGDVSHLLTNDFIAAGGQANKNLKDERIKAFVALAPALGQGYTQAQQLAQVRSPLLIIGAANDARTPLPTNAQHYRQFIKHAEYLVIREKAGHYVFMNAANQELANEAPEIFQDHASVNRQAVHDTVARATLDFFGRALPKR